MEISDYKRGIIVGMCLAALIYMGVTAYYDLLRAVYGRSVLVPVPVPVPDNPPPPDVPHKDE